MELKNNKFFIILSKAGQEKKLRGGLSSRRDRFFKSIFLPAVRAEAGPGALGRPTVPKKENFAFPCDSVIHNNKGWFSK